MWQHNMFVKSFWKNSHNAAGDVELLTGITPGTDVELVSYIFPTHLEYLELNFTLGEDRATVRTKKPLDADALISVSSVKHNQ